MSGLREVVGYPTTSHPMLQAVGRRAMRLAGWRFSGTLAALPKFVLIIAPHTSNWDFMIGLAAKLALDLEAHWFGKHGLFRGPLGAFMRRIGGRAVKRESSEGVVAELAEMFEGEQKFVLVITPEGTRKRVTRWRTGFYHIARAAGVPIVPVAFDWGRKEIVLHPPFIPTGDPGRDLAALRALFRPAMAYHPANFASGAEEPAARG